MERKKWRSVKGKGGGFSTLVLGEKPGILPEKSFISLTRGEGFNFFQLIINQILTLMVMNQMKKAPGLLYAELNGELKDRKGYGQTITVWVGSRCRNLEISGPTGLR
ncbi:hypothetical protein ACJROX_02690 [Pseudalkalibacillus sp. A8]|uniref:hypothetical protein n=1 Tax=Pseudalkalibacillus sp. A8 TaxID=3382641 RepID=UPI0038B45B47